MLITDCSLAATANAYTIRTEMAVICSTLAATLIGLVLPAVQQHFHAVPGIRTLVPVVLTLPMLMPAVPEASIDWFADKVGREHVLIAALLIYAIAGTVSLYLNSVFSILLSQIVVGVAEAAAMTIIRSRFPAVRGWGHELLTVASVALLPAVRRRGEKPP